jgi:hypothetical protein
MRCFSGGLQGSDIPCHGDRAMEQWRRMSNGGDRERKRGKKNESENSNERLSSKKR